MPRTVEVASTLGRAAPEVWARVTTPAGIRDELWPVLRMTTPPGLRGVDGPLPVAALGERLGRPLGRAWLFLLGLVPVEVDAMTVVALEPGRSFHTSAHRCSPCAAGSTGARCGRFPRAGARWWTGST